MDGSRAELDRMLEMPPLLSSARVFIIVTGDYEPQVYHTSLSLQTISSSQSKTPAIFNKLKVHIDISRLDR